MRVLSLRDPAPSASARHEFSPRRRRATVEPMLPALIRGVAFLSVLAMPFVAALLMR
jgi:hypothetical protein